MSSSPGPTRHRAFVFVGGGTGGHIYPALAIIEQLRAIKPDVGVHILCSTRAIDAQILEKEDVPFSPIPAMPVSKNFGGLIRFIASWGPSVHATRQLIRSFTQSHDSVVLVAMGGFVAAPGARAGHAQKVPVVLVNLDAVPGKANVLIAKKAQEIFSAADIAGHDAWQRVRPIVRLGAMNQSDIGSARAAFGLDPMTKTLLVTGGSQGAASITSFVRAIVEQRPDIFADWQVIHQVGNKITDAKIDELRSIYRDAKISAWVERYIDEMGKALVGSDLTIARCGAGTVAECWAAKIPSVFFPYPYHKDEHQKHNAKVLVDAGAAMILTDLIDPDRNFQAYSQSFAQVLISHEAREQMRSGFDTLASPDGAKTIAEQLLAIT